jgi:hypothetical protein
MRQRVQPNGTKHDLFLDFPTSKTYLAELLGVSRSTVYLWENLIFWRLPAFAQAYPKDKEGSFDRTAPLSPYQAWVICRVGRLMKQVVTAERVKQGIAKNPNYLSMYTYKTALRNLNKLAA